MTLAIVAANPSEPANPCERKKSQRPVHEDQKRKQDHIGYGYMVKREVFHRKFNLLKIIKDKRIATTCQRKKLPSQK